ncbi:mini-chromosome maintenance complex-binding protein [Aricia agestis]|uniref:mini-chromosome maintenance complex-binding protein n=1 Tax=Aricia agestis TaxID=91739 RepID=UPI001C201B9A|nr:mini-chromosome maintenance complex-binding protein [Aricia agestis]
MQDSIHDFDNVTPHIWLSNENTWKEKLLKLPNWNKIPLINSNASHNLSDGALVRFRGMVQDMYNPEFYLEQFNVLNTNTKTTTTKSGKYTETADVLEHEKILHSDEMKCSQRQKIVVVSIPGLNEWAQKLEDEQNRLTHLDQHPNSTKRLTSSTQIKRSYEETEDDPEAMDTAENEINKRERKTDEPASAPGTVVSREHLLNFPLPDVASKSCIVKLYENDDNLKVNDIVEVVGFLSVDPALSAEFKTEKNALVEPVVETDVEIITHNPPPSLIPRVHAVHLRTLEHCNPLLSNEYSQENVLKEANVAREHLLKALKELLLGDQLAAEYLICHLIACIYLRQETLTLGKFGLNISNLPIQKYSNYGQQLYDIIKQFVTQSYYLPLTIENLNTMALLPKKDYDSNRLTSGILQMGKHTHLVLDETKMEQGRLDNTGVNNVAALAKLITQQTIEYDFKFYKKDFDSDVSVLILSEGKSLLPSDYHVILKPEESTLQIFDAIVEAATYYLKEDIMNTIRAYLTNLKLAKYTVSENVQFVEDDFIQMRNNPDNDGSMTADDLHRLLVLARLVSLSRGFDSLNKECWDIAKAMESERLLRIKNRVAPTL